MKIKLDENIPARLAKELARLGHEVDTVYQEGLKGHPDPDVWSAAQATGRFLVTQDMDFSDLRRFTPGTHAGLLLVRLREPGRQALLEHVRRLFETETVERWTSCFVVSTEHKLRVRSPKPSAARVTRSIVSRPGEAERALKMGELGGSLGGTGR